MRFTIVDPDGWQVWTNAKGQPRFESVSSATEAKRKLRNLVGPNAHGQLKVSKDGTVIYFLSVRDSFHGRTAAVKGGKQRLSMILGLQQKTGNKTYRNVAIAGVAALGTLLGVSAWVGYRKLKTLRTTLRRAESDKLKAEEEVERLKAVHEGTLKPQLQEALAKIDAQEAAALQLRQELEAATAGDVEDLKAKYEAALAEKASLEEQLKGSEEAQALAQQLEAARQAAATAVARSNRLAREFLDDNFFRRRRFNGQITDSPILEALLAPDPARNKAYNFIFLKPRILFIQNGEFDPASEKNAKFAQELRKLVKTQQAGESKYTATLITLENLDKGYTHGNALFVTSDAAYLFDPQSSTAQPFLVSLQAFFAKEGIEHLWTNRFHPQGEEQDIANPDEDPVGYCMAWSTFVMSVASRNPNFNFESEENIDQFETYLEAFVSSGCDIEIRHASPKHCRLQFIRRFASAFANADTRQFGSFRVDNAFYRRLHSTTPNLERAATSLPRVFGAIAWEFRRSVPYDADLYVKIKEDPEEIAKVLKQPARHVYGMSHKVGTEVFKLIQANPTLIMTHGGRKPHEVDLSMVDWLTRFYFNCMRETTRVAAATVDSYIASGGDTPELVTWAQAVVELTRKTIVQPKQSWQFQHWTPTKKKTPRMYNPAKGVEGKRAHLKIYQFILATVPQDFAPAFSFSVLFWLKQIAGDFFVQPGEEVRELDLEKWKTLSLAYKATLNQ